MLSPRVRPFTTRAGLAAAGVRAALCAALCLALCALPTVASAKSPSRPAAVPQGFVGVDANGPLLAAGTPLTFSGQTQRMVASGVESIRVQFDWQTAEPYATVAQVPATQQSRFTDVDGVPIDFQQTDAIVTAAAQRHLSVLPVVLYAPAWDAVTRPGALADPQDPGPYAAYLTALIKRYGPHGSFWTDHPRLPKQPVREWQIWNEPNLTYYWPQPFAASYVALLRAAHTAIKAADPGAKVVLGSLTDKAWNAIATIYAIKGSASLFDVAAVNAFTDTPANVIRYLRYMRRALIHYKDPRKPLLAGELSWPSARGHIKTNYDFDTTEAGQARDIAQVLALLGRNYRALNLAGFDYYNWIGQEAPLGPSSQGTVDFDFAGLLALRNGKVVAKPALAAFRTGALALEGCQRKGANATACLH